MKRLRFHYPGRKIKYFHAGEYGERFGRPHHHACLFGIDFPDKRLWDIRQGNRLYTSKILDEIWGHGSCIIGDVTFESVAYIARYIMKKIKGESQAAQEMAAAHYRGRTPEYSTMSRRPGLGAGWYEKYKGDLYPKDFTVIRGKKIKIPKYYDKLHQVNLTNAIEFDLIRKERIRNARYNPDMAPARLEAAEAIKQAQLNLLPRRLEKQ